MQAQASAQAADQRSRQHHKGGVHRKEPAGDKGQRHQYKAKPALVAPYVAPHGDDDVGNHRGDRGPHRLEQRAYGRVVADLLVEDRYDGDDDQRRQHGAQDGAQRARHACHLVPDEDGGVDGDGPRRGLGDGGQIHHLLLLQPA